MLQLYGSGASPFVRKARVLLAEAGIDDVDYVEVSASPMGGEDRVNAANPLGKIPSLVRDNGPTIYDSNVICRFLDDHAGGLFYPAGPPLGDPDAGGHRRRHHGGRGWRDLRKAFPPRGTCNGPSGTKRNGSRSNARSMPSNGLAQPSRRSRPYGSDRGGLCAWLPRPALPRPRLARRASGFDSVVRDIFAPARP
jgi:hypothetical protein